MKTLKSILILVTILFSFNSSYSQYSGCFTKSELEKRFLGTKTYVVGANSENFDKNVMAGMKEYWTLTEFEFISNDDFKELKQTEEMTILQVGSKFHTYDGVDYYYGVLGLRFGNDKDYKIKKGGDAFIAYANTDENGLEKHVWDADYRAQNMVKMIHDILVEKLEGKLQKTTCLRNDYLEDYYNRNASQVKSKVLLVNEIHLTKISEEDFSKSYTGDFEVVTSSEIEEAIMSNKEGYAYLCPIFAKRKHVVVVDCETGSILCDKMNSNTFYKLNGGDIKKLNKLIFN